MEAEQSEHTGRVEEVMGVEGVEGVEGAEGATIERADPASEAARWCIDQYVAELARRFDGGFDTTRSLPADDDDLRPPRGVVLVAGMGGKPVACGAIKIIAPGVGSLKRMWVSGSVRGLGFGRRMLAALEAEARELGLATLRLETNRTLTEAIQLYRSAGYVEVAPFNSEPYANHWFEKHID
jgi:GNAT superfamily N-acetyltransferase